MADDVRKNLNERRSMAITNTRRELVYALSQLEEAAKYPDLTCNDARRALVNARQAILSAGMVSDFGIEDPPRGK